MKIHFFTKRNDMCGSSRQRVFQIVEELHARGFEADVHRPSACEISETPWPEKFTVLWQHILALREIKKGDIVYLQRPINNKYFSILLVIYTLVFRRKTFFDMDDAVFAYMPVRTKLFTYISDVIIVGCHPLMEWSKTYNAHIEFIPTSVRFEKYKAWTRNYSKKNEKLTIGWVGGANYHYENLKLLAPVFQKLVTAKIPLKFILVGASKNQKVYDLFNSIVGLDVQLIDAVDWTDQHSVPKVIQEFDIGVMPLVDELSTRYKCSFKAIEYMACGVVPIISSVGENSYLVQDGVNGFLANTTDEWVQKIIHVYENPQIYSEVGARAQQKIKEYYSFDAIVTKLIEIFSRI